jgi:SAM-dependent methyltransferase
MRECEEQETSTHGRRFSIYVRESGTPYLVADCRDLPVLSKVGVERGRAQMSHSDIVYTHNGLGWTSTIPNQITCEWLDFIHKGQEQPMRVLDIGAGFGVASIPALKHGARVIANDIERSHLDAIRKEASDLGYADQLETVVGRFPGDLAFAELDAIHCSNVLHFLRGEEIVAGAARMHSWLRSGGRVFIQVGTVYAGHVKRLLPQFEERRRKGVRWAGETDRAREFVCPELRDEMPEFLNYSDGDPLVEAFEKAGFHREKAWYYTRTGMPELCLNDGRENFGYVGSKC